MSEFDPLDDAALLALGVLPESEARAARGRIAGDAAALAEYHELRSVADAVGLSADADADADLSAASAARMRASVLAAVRATLSGERSSDAVHPHVVNGVATNGTAPVSVGSLAERAERRRARPWYARVELLATAAVLVAALIGADDLHERDVAARASALADGSAARIAAAQDAAAQAARAFRISSDGDARRYPIPQGSVVAGHRGIVLALAKLPAPPPGKVYQAWTLARGSTAMTPSVTFRPGADGSALVEVPTDASGLAAVAVSVEPEGGSPAPTSKPTFVRTLG
jgi:anti-sigma-K factor RskA